MDAYQLTIPGLPIPRERARRGPHSGVFYTPKSTRDYAVKVQMCALAARIKVIPGPISLELVFYLPNRRREDFDNLAKAVTDPLNGLAWTDDSELGWWPAQVTIQKVLDQVDPRVEMKWWSVTHASE